MTHKFADITFTNSVKAAQLHYGSRPNNERLQAVAGPNDQLGPREAGFIAVRDTFYLATVSESGWPYVQHRGGPGLQSTHRAGGIDRCSRIRLELPATYHATIHRSGDGRTSE